MRANSTSYIRRRANTRSSRRIKKHHQVIMRSKHLGNDATLVRRQSVVTVWAYRDNDGLVTTSLEPVNRVPRRKINRSSPDRSAFTGVRMKRQLQVCWHEPLVYIVMDIQPDLGCRIDMLFPVRTTGDQQLDNVIIGQLQQRVS